MGTQISDWLRRVSTGWVAVGALIIFLLFSALVLPQQATVAEQETGSADSPDTSLFYSPADLYRMAEAYGEGGRRAYIRARFTFDLIWPLVYTFFLVTAISWAFSRAFPPDSLWQRANLAPLLGALFDYLENLSTSLVMARYPDGTAVAGALWALLAPLFTLSKWSFLGVGFLLLSVGLVVGTWRWIVGRSQAGGGGSGQRGS
jgi:hypothetical protein